MNQAQGMFGDGWEAAHLRVKEWKESMKEVKT